MTDINGMSDADLIRLIQTASQAPQSTPVGPDVAKSAGAGLAKGAIGVLGIPGDIGALASYGAERAGVPEDMRKFAGKALSAFPLTRPFAAQPTSQEIQSSVEGQTGEFYKPKTGLGKAAHTLGEFTPGAALPGGMIQRGMNVVAPAAGAEIGEAVTGGPMGRMAGALAGGIAGARMITPAAATPERLALARTLENEGVQLTAGQRTGNRPLQWFEQAAADTPLAAGRAAQLNENQGRQFTGAVMRRIGASGDEIATPDAVNRAVTNLSNRFEAIGSRNTLNPDQAMVNDLMQTARTYVGSVIPSQRAGGQQNIETIINDVVGQIQQHGGNMPGPLYQATRSRLGRMSDGVRESDPQLSTAIRGIRDSLDDAMGRSIPAGERAEWRELRTQWKNWKAVEKATSGAGSATAEGFISPSQLRTAVAGQNRGQYARGQGDMADIARAGEALLKPLPQSGTAPRQAAGNTFASIAGMLGGSAAGGLPGAIAGAMVPAVAGRAMLSGPMQRYLGNQVAPMTPQQMRSALIAEQLLARPRGQDSRQ